MKSSSFVHTCDTESLSKDVARHELVNFINFVNHMRVTSVKLYAMWCGPITFVQCILWFDNSSVVPDWLQVYHRVAAVPLASRSDPVSFASFAVVGPPLSLCIQCSYVQHLHWMLLVLLLLVDCCWTARECWILSHLVHPLECQS